LALQEYEGGMVLISHDRSLLRTTCDQFILVNGGKAKIFDGDLDDYSLWVAEQRNKDNNQAVSEEESGNKNNRYVQSKLDRQVRLAARRPLLKESEKLEREIAAWQQEKTACDVRLNDPDLYENNDKSELQALLKQQSELTFSIEQAEERWLTVHEQLETMPEISG